MNEGKTNRVRRRRVAAMALVCILALLATPLCPLNCSGAGCHKAQTTFVSGEECHGAAPTGSAQIRSAKIMACDAPALAVRVDGSAERLRKISRLGAGTSIAAAMNLTPSASFFRERDLRWGFDQRPGYGLAEARSILPLRI